MNEERWKKLEVWKLADDLAQKLFRISADFPEAAGLGMDLRRAALSVPRSIVAGWSRKGENDLSRFVNQGLGHLAESGYLLYFARQLGYVGEKDYLRLQESGELLGKKLWRLHEKIENPS